jgi:hypothetical protein
LPGPSRRDPDDEGLRYVWTAFQWQYNLIALGAAGLFALISASALPLVLAAGAELIYLSTVPHMGAFRRLVRSWHYAEEKRLLEVRRRALLRELPPGLQKRYADLGGVCRDIRANYARLSSTSQIFFRQVDANLDELLQAYMRLLNTSQQQGGYLRTDEDQQIHRELAQLKERIEKDEPKVQEINRKRIEIMEKRLEKFDAIRKNLQVIDAQCGALEDVLHLIRDQSVTITDPQQITGQLESLMHDVEQTEDTVRQVESIYAMSAGDPLDTVAPLPSPPSPTSSPSPRNRTRS